MTLPIEVEEATLVDSAWAKDVASVSLNLSRNSPLAADLVS